MGGLVPALLSLPSLSSISLYVHMYGQGKVLNLGARVGKTKSGVSDARQLQQRRRTRWPQLRPMTQTQTETQMKALTMKLKQKTQA